MEQQLQRSSWDSDGRADATLQFLVQKMTADRTNKNAQRIQEMDAAGRLATVSTALSAILQERDAIKAANAEKIRLNELNMKAEELAQQQGLFGDWDGRSNSNLSINGVVVPPVELNALANYSTAKNNEGGWDVFYGDQKIAKASINYSNPAGKPINLTLMRGNEGRAGEISRLVFVNAYQDINNQLNNVARERVASSNVSITNQNNASENYGNQANDLINLLKSYWGH